MHSFPALKQYLRHFKLNEKCKKQIYTVVFYLHNVLELIFLLFRKKIKIVFYSAVLPPFIRRRAVAIRSYLRLLYRLGNHSQPVFHISHVV